MAEQWFFLQQRHALRAIQSGGTYPRHCGSVARDDLLIRAGEQFPGKVKLEAGVVFLRPLAIASGSGSRDRLVLEGRNILVPGDNAFERLSILVPEQQVGPQLEILSGVQSNKMNIVQRADHVAHPVTADLPGSQLKLYRLLLVHVAQQLIGQASTYFALKQYEKASDDSLALKGRASQKRVS